MTQSDATAEVFWTAFRVLPRKAKQAVLQRLVQDKGLRHDLVDLAMIESRRREPTRPLREYISDSRRSRPLHRPQGQV